MAYVVFIPYWWHELIFLTAEVLNKLIYLIDKQFLNVTRKMNKEFSVFNVFSSQKENRVGIQKGKISSFDNASHISDVGYKCPKLFYVGPISH